MRRSAAGGAGASRRSQPCSGSGATSHRFAAQFRAAAGCPEPFRTAEQVAGDIGARSIDDPRVAAEMRAEVAAFHRLIPVILLEDTRSQVGIIADRTRAAAQTSVHQITHDQVEALARARMARVAAGEGTIRPGALGLPHWNAEKGSGLPWRALSFGPDTERQAMETVASWMADDLAAQMAERAQMRKLGIGL